MSKVKAQDFLKAVAAIAAAKPSYRLGGSGTDGTCDCIGLIIGAIRRAGGAWKGTHGSNWAARNAMDTLASPAPLEMGCAVYKAREPGVIAYDLPEDYAGHPDQRDYYHVGVVTCVSPLRITHCTGGTANGIKVDTSIGQWRYGGRLKGVDYAGEEVEEVAEMVNETAETVNDTADVEYETAVVRAPSGSTVRMRVRPSMDAIALAYVPVGVTVDVTEKTGEWWRIRYGGKTGWMQAQYLDGTYATPAGDMASPGGGEYVMVRMADLNALAALVARMQAGGAK